MFDLLAGLPRVALSKSHCLNGEVTTPFGQEPTADGVEAKWRSLVGADRPVPPWLVLGHRETPSGIVWRILFCPPSGTLADDAEVVLPMAAWVGQLLGVVAGPSGWHVRITRSGDDFWGGVWEGERCVRIHGPYRTRELLEHRCQHGIEDAAEAAREIIEVPWRQPSQAGLRELAGDQPSGDLLGWELSVQRSRVRRRHVALARIGGIAAVFLLVSGGFGLFQLGAWRVRAIQETRLASVQGELDAVGRLRERTRSLVDSLLSRRDALVPNSSPDKILRSVARAVPATVKLQVFALEPTTNGYRARFEARFLEWSDVQPFSDALRRGGGVKRVAVVSQTRQADAVMAVMEIEGQWP
ncbi:MAG TPA: hypothetical protein PKY05_03990 [Fibrobacteria bacterium]|nr:hypothetical protein [Fibrobacteria bacterium]